MGYFNSEHTKIVKDWKEVFDFAPQDELELPISVDPNDPYTKLVKNRWPDSLVEFKYIIMIASTFFFLFCFALGIERHKDVGALTLFYQDEVGGLEVKCKENEQWVPAPPMPNSFILNVANCVQVMANDKYESVEHRAMVKDTRRRLSIPLFLIPSHYAMIKPLDEFVSKENPPKFKEFNWGKFTRQRMREGLKNMGVADIQIDNFRI
ncbi:hypothetical protein SUGI_1033890 [Cryptomeria japonica]|nr:hypothetical protein SUGI_1033890 [Cryptomeria japonica]